MRRKMTAKEKKQAAADRARWRQADLAKFPGALWMQEKAEKAPKDQVQPEVSLHIESGVFGYLEISSLGAAFEWADEDRKDWCRFRFYLNDVARLADLTAALSARLRHLIAKVNEDVKVIKQLPAIEDLPAPENLGD